MDDKDVKLYAYLTTYKKDYLKKNPKSIKASKAEQEFKDPITEGFRNYLVVDSNVNEPQEDGDGYLEKVKKDRKKIGKIYFDEPLDHLTIKGTKLLNGKSVYQVEYCDIEEDIRRKLIDSSKKRSWLPEGWVMPMTTHTSDFRNPTSLSKDALEPPLVVKPIDNLGHNEKINDILNIKTGESEYEKTIGDLGGFIVENQMHGKIHHPDCTCLQQNINKT